MIQYHNVTYGSQNFQKLWNRLRSTYLTLGELRMVAVLNNNSLRKEEICRKLGVISDMDINRISETLSDPKKGKRK